MTELYRCLSLSLLHGKLRKLVLSKPADGSAKKAVGRLCTLRGEPALTVEETLGGGKVAHKNYRLSALTAGDTDDMCARYRQINLCTADGDAEYRRSKNGKETLIGGAALLKKLADTTVAFTENIAIDRKKSYILSGNEPFLKHLGITAENGRIHDKKQAKFRQINRFLEHIADICSALPEEGKLLVYDLCCGKSYLSFAVYHYLTAVKGREVEMLGIDLKSDVIAFCNETAEACGFHGMTFRAGDIRKTPRDRKPDLVISLHACDIATDIVLDTAASLGATVILSTPCCHRYMHDKFHSPALSFIGDYPYLKNKLCDVATDALRLMRLEAKGYRTTALELTDPDDTPKNTLLRAVRRRGFSEDSPEAEALRSRYTEALRFFCGRDADRYLADVLSPDTGANHAGGK